MMLYTQNKTCKSWFVANPSNINKFLLIKKSSTKKSCKIVLQVQIIVSNN